MYAIKPIYQKLFRGLAGNWMSPNMATGLGVLFSIGTCAAFWLGSRFNPLFFLLVPLGMIFRMGANALDGMLAREKGLASPLGAVLNELTDVVNDMICYAPLWFVPGIRHGLLTTFLLLILLAEFAGLLGQAVSGKRRYEGPLGGKTDRATWMSLFAGLCAFQPAALAWSDYGLGLVGFFVLLTAGNRLRLAVVEASLAKG